MTTPTDTRYTNNQLITHTNMNNIGNDLITLHKGNYTVSGPGAGSVVSTDSTTTSQTPTQMMSAVPLTKNAGGSILVIMWGTFSISAGTGFVGVEIVADVNNLGEGASYLPANYDIKIIKQTKTAITYSKIITIPNFYTGSTVYIVPYWYTSSGGTLTLYNTNTLLIAPGTVNNNPSVLVGGY